jgi:hypothetical protein
MVRIGKSKKSMEEEQSILFCILPFVFLEINFKWPVVVCV